jgi:HAD superfamily hydrolase (TIGR01549 family)
VIRSVVFDVGETLTDDRRFWAGWADWLGVPHHTMSALVGAVTATGKNNAEALRLIRPDLDVATERAAREAAGRGEVLDETDLYPDVRPTLAALRDAGFWVGIAGNQTSRAADLLRALGLPVDAIVTSGEWGVAKPASEFFGRLVEWAPGEPEQIVYVGDHRDNDVLPARAAGLCVAFIRRGPWGYLWADDPAVAEAARWRIDSLAELPYLLAASEYRSL